MYSLEITFSLSQMDNLIAAGKAKPMVVVMTNGNPTCQAAPGEWSAGMYVPSAMGI